MRNHTPHYPGRIVPTLVNTTASADARHEEVATFIHAHFAAVYGADIQRFLPVLMSLRADDGRLLGALGLRTAADGPLFLERYLDRPLEQALAAAIKAPVNRKELIEVGNLAVAAPGGGRWLITALTAYLHAAGQRWAVFTCGPRLRNAFFRLGIELTDLGRASIERLPEDEAVHWGDYYAQHPRLMAARVAQSHQVLASLFRTECALTALWQHANEAGHLAHRGQAA